MFMGKGGVRFGNRSCALQLQAHAAAAVRALGVPRLGICKRGISAWQSFIRLGGSRACMPDAAFELHKCMMGMVSRRFCMAVPV